MLRAVPGERGEILEGLARGNVFQPATAIWRVYEIEAVRMHARFSGRVMDLGCGDGSLSRVVFRGASCRIVGVEPDAADARAAELSGLYEKVHTAPGDRVPEPDGSFDMVFSNSVLEHIPDLKPVLAEVSRLLRPGGRFVITVPSDEFHRCLQGKGVLPLLWRLRGDTPETAIDRRLQHHRYWSPEDWRRELADVGLRVDQTLRYFPERAVHSWERWSNATGGVAFELFRGRTQTRGAQRKLGLTAMEKLLTDRSSAQILSTLISHTLQEPASPGAAPSGGLLVEAVRSAS